MVSLAPGIVVNGVKISPEQINFEVQYHPAATLEDARYAAMKALVIRELLLQICRRNWCWRRVSGFVTERGRSD